MMRTLLLTAASALMLIALAPPAPMAKTPAPRTLSHTPQEGLGTRIASRAEGFIGTPYDTDPKGAYVSSRRIVFDKQVDCMYLVFRSVEMALSNTPAQAVETALDMRFITHGLLGPDKLVTNYDDRFQYAMDMVKSGKWGMDITSELGAQTIEIPGDRNHGPVRIIPAGTVDKALRGLQSGDIIYFVKDPAKRVVGEIIGHMGILKREGNEVYLIHASGRKSYKGRKGGGEVRKLLLAEYASSMPFVGIIVTRFDYDLK